MPKGTKGIKRPDRQTTLSERLRARMRERYQITLPERPLDERGDEYVPSLPPDITSISDDYLGRLQGQYAAYADYVESCVACAEIDDLEGRNTLEREEARQRLRRQGEEGSTVQSRADDAFLDPAAARVRDAATERKAARTFMRARLNQLDRDMKVLSREQSRREALREAR